MARGLHGTESMKPSDFTAAERWLVIAACLPLIGAGLFILLV